MRLTERRGNGGKRKWRQIGQENFKREIRKKEVHKRKRETAGSVEPGKPPPLPAQMDSEKEKQSEIRKSTSLA